MAYCRGFISKTLILEFTVTRQSLNDQLVAKRIVMSKDARRHYVHATTPAQYILIQLLNIHVDWSMGQLVCLATGVKIGVNGAVALALNRRRY
jgi:hypothetical protein